MTEEQLSALLRLKRHEQPPAGYYDQLLRDVHRRQRAELLQRPLWKIAVERMQTFFGEHSISHTSYAGALASVLIAGIAAISFFSPRPGQQGGARELAATTLPSPHVPVISLDQGPTPHQPIFDRQLTFKTTQSARPPRLNSRATSSMRVLSVMSPRSVSRVGNAALCAATLLLPAALARANEEPAIPRNTAETQAKTVFDSIQEQVNTLFAKCRGAVVRVEARDNHGELAGTGFFIDPQGTLYTSWTVGGDESRDLVVCHGNMRYPARRLVADFRCGVAILKIDAETPFLPLGESRSLTVASPVLTIGYPMDLPLTPSFGMVGGFDLKYLGRYFATTHIRANVAVQRGEGGAPLLNMHGEVVGVLISSLDQGSASFVLPIEAAEKVRRDYVRFGEVRPGWVGMAIGPASAAVAGSTAEVQDIQSDGPAQKAGVKPGDVLLKVGGRDVRSPDDVVDASFFITAEDPLNIRVARAGGEMDIQVNPAEPPVIKRSLLSPSLTTDTLKMEK